MATRGMSAEKWLTLGALGVGLYLLSKLGKFGAETADSVAAFIADKYIRLTLPEPVGVQGFAILPDGSLVSMSQLAVKKVPNQEFFYFDYRAQRYQLGPRTSQGNYPTRKVPTP